LSSAKLSFQFLFVLSPILSLSYITTQVITIEAEKQKEVKYRQNFKQKGRKLRLPCEYN